MELKSFRRVSESKIVVDGILWGTDPEKATEIKNNETGGRLLSIKLEGTYYYPYAIDFVKRKTQSI
jgi:hypothetical protein